MLDTCLLNLTFSTSSRFFPPLSVNIMWVKSLKQHRRICSFILRDTCARVLTVRRVGNFWIGSLWGVWYKEALVSQNAVIYKASFSKFCLIICAEVRFTQQSVSQAIWYAFLCISRQDPLSRDRAGRFSNMMDNFCFTTRLCCFVVVLFIVLVYFYPSY